MSNDDNFNFIGLPSNEPIHVEDKKPKRNGIPNLDNLDFGNIDFSKLAESLPIDLIVSMLPPDVLNTLEKEAETSGESLESYIRNVVKFEMGGMPANSNSKNNITSQQPQNKDSGLYKHELGDDKYLNPSSFGSIPCIRDENIYENFIKMYGDDSSKYLDDNGIKNLILTDLTETLPVEEIAYLTLAEYNNTFILFYAQPKDESKYGFFVSVIEMPDGDFALFVPEFFNTFKVLDDGSVTLYDPAVDRVFFRSTMNGKQEFIPFSMSGLELSTMFQLAPQNKCLLTPHQFGTIKNVMAPVMNDSDFLKIGNIISNESPAAILLKKDAELPLNETKFPLYVKFDHTVSQSTLLALSAKFFKVDFNDCQLLDNCELKYNSSHELYIELDLGDI